MHHVFDGICTCSWERDVEFGGFLGGQASNSCNVDGEERWNIVLPLYF